MKKIVALLLLSWFWGAAKSKQPYRDSLQLVFAIITNDSMRYKAASHLYDYYEELDRDSALYYADLCVLVSRKNDRAVNLAYFLSRKAYQEQNKGQYARSLHSLLNGFLLAEDPGNSGKHWSIDPLLSGIDSEKGLINFIKLLNRQVKERG